MLTTIREEKLIIKRHRKEIRDTRGQEGKRGKRNKRRRNVLEKEGPSSLMLLKFAGTGLLTL